MLFDTDFRDVLKVNDGSFFAGLLVSAEWRSGSRSRHFRSHTRSYVDIKTLIHVGSF